MHNCNQSFLFVFSGCFVSFKPPWVIYLQKHVNPKASPLPWLSLQWPSFLACRWCSYPLQKQSYFVSQMLPYPGEDVQDLHSEKSVPIGGSSQKKADLSRESPSLSHNAEPLWTSKPVDHRHLRKRCTFILIWHLIKQSCTNSSPDACSHTNAATTLAFKLQDVKLWKPFTMI